MTRLLLAAALAALCARPAGAALWVENDYSFGSNGLAKNSLSVFTIPVRNLTTGLNASFYKDGGAYDGKVWSFRLPLTYSGPRWFVSLKPFLYPVDGDTRSGAYGGKLFLLASAQEGNDESYLRLSASGAWAKQQARALVSASPEEKKFDQSAFELQAEKSFYGQFYFLASAAAFSKPSGVSNQTLITPAMDQSELAYLGVFRHVTALPDWVMTAQVARNMKPDYDSYIYAGYSKISYRRSDKAGSFIGGIKLNLNEKTNLDLAYNAYKQDGAAWKSYYKLLLQLFF
ncbi:MAG: hypothetical protein ACYC2I_09205 [Elusimicrobiales bacterium]